MRRCTMAGSTALSLALLLSASTASALGTDPDPNAPSDPFAADAPPPAPPPDPDAAHAAPPPQIVEQTPVVVVQQPAVAAPVAPPVRPARRLRYRPGQPIPPGYQPVSRSRTGLWIPGLILLAVPWAISAGVAANDPNLGDLYIPVIGPFLARDNVGSLAQSGLILDGIMQTAGAVMLVLGLTLKRHYLVYVGDASGRYVALNAGLGGLALSGRF